MEASVDQFHLILYVQKPKPAIKNDMPSGFWFTNMVMNIGAELGLEASMSPQRRSVTVRRGFVCRCVGSYFKNILFDSLSHIFSGLRKPFQNVFCLWKANVKMDGRREREGKKGRKLTSCPPTFVSTSPARLSPLFHSQTSSLYLPPPWRPANTGLHFETLARPPELGMLKRPGLVFFSVSNFKSPPAPQGAGPHTSLGE